MKRFNSLVVPFNLLVTFLNISVAHVCSFISSGNVFVLSTAPNGCYASQELCTVLNSHHSINICLSFCTCVCQHHTRRSINVYYLIWAH